MSDSSDKHPIANDLINLVIAVIPWLFPDSPLVIKILTSLVFGAIIIIARSKPNFVTNLWSPFYYFVVISLPIAIGILSWEIDNIPVLGSKFSLTGLPSDTLTFGTGFGIIVGIPLSIYGAYFGQKSQKSILRDVVANLGGGFSGCLIQIVTFIILMAIALSSVLNGTVKPMAVDQNGKSVTLLSDIFTPPMRIALGSVGPFIGRGLISYIENKEFSFLWLAGAFILNAIFVLVGFALGKIHRGILNKRPT